MGQEILAPERVDRDANGRFAPGHEPMGHRPLGAKGLLRREVFAMVTEALSAAGGVDYLVMQAYLNPGPFLALVGKTMPIKVEGDDSGAPTRIAVTRRVFVDQIAPPAPQAGESDDT